MKAPLAIALILAAPVPASAGFYSYSDWSQMDRESRNAYLAGAVDALTGMASGAADAQNNRRIVACIQKTDMSVGQMADNVQSFAASNPRFQRVPVPAILLNYLNQLCSK